MTKKEPYSYVALRYVHDILTGEFINVGLVLAVPGRSMLLTRSRKTFGRIKSVFPDLDSDAYKSAIGAVERGLRQVERSLKAEGFLKSNRSAQDYGRIAVPLDDSSLQWSPVGTGLTSDPEATFEQLYQRLVMHYEKSTVRHRSDDDVWRLVSSKLKERQIPVELKPKRVDGETDSVLFRHAWKNGKWHVYEPLSFDLSDADNIKDKARRWLGHLTAVREGVTEDIQLNFIVGRPQSPSLESAYRKAIEIVSHVPFENAVFEEDSIDQVVEMIEDEVRLHEGRAN